MTRWREDMNFIFSWQEQHLTRSLRSLVRYCSCHSNIKFISSGQRVISSIYNLIHKPFAVSQFLRNLTNVERKSAHHCSHETVSSFWLVFNFFKNLCYHLGNQTYGIKFALDNIIMSMNAPQNLRTLK